jgi:hypothetical protein
LKPQIEVKCADRAVICVESEEIVLIFCWAPIACDS